MIESRTTPPTDGLGGVVFDIKKYAVHDGPGIRTTVYLKGCPLSCLWCHNPEGQAGEPEIVYWERRCINCGRCVEVCPQGDAVLGAASCERCGRCVEVCPAGAREWIGRWMTVDEVMAQVERDVIFYDESGGGVTFSGGEPFNQPAFLGGLLAASREREIHTAVDTTGFAPAGVIRALAPGVDLFLYDVKLLDDEAHRRYTGVSNRLPLENLRWLAAEGYAIQIRVPIIPGITDGDDNLDAIGRLAGQLNLEAIDLLPYHRTASDKYGRLQRDYTLAATRPPEPARMTELSERLIKLGLTVRIGG
jgi:pyruvate formate lyase activating enzyme